MKKVLFILCGVLFFATSCLNVGPSSGSSSVGYTGHLVVTDLQTDEVTYSDDKAQVVVTIPNVLEPKFDFRFNGIKFSAMMPKLNIDVLGIPFTTTISEDETSINYVFDANNMVPEVGGIEYQKFKIDHIWGQVGKTVEILFTMESKGSKVHFTSSTTSGEGSNEQDAME